MEVQNFLCRILVAFFPLGFCAKWKIAVFKRKTTPITCLDLDYASGQLKLEDWLYIITIFFTIFTEETSFYWQFGRGGLYLLILFKLAGRIKWL